MRALQWRQVTASEHLLQNPPRISIKASLRRTVHCGLVNTGICFLLIKLLIFKRGEDKIPQSPMSCFVCDVPRGKKF